MRDRASSESATSSLPFATSAICSRVSLCPRSKIIEEQKSEVRDQRSDVRGQRSEVKGQMSDVRGQQSDIRHQMVCRLSRTIFGGQRETLSKSDLWSLTLTSDL